MSALPVSCRSLAHILLNLAWAAFDALAIGLVALLILFGVAP